jgi:ribosomal-protein-alanine N-acetyltransferase
MLNIEKDVRMPASLEDASIRHLDTLCEIERQCFEKEAFTRKQISQLLANYNCVSLIAKESNEIVGFIIGMIRTDRNTMSGHILTIDILPAYRRRGIGQMLLQEIERIFKEKGVRNSYLEVREDNVAAAGLYQKLGYREIGKLENYYGNAHGICLKKTLG